MLAIDFGHHTIIPHLISKSLEQGEDINVGDMYGKTAPHYALIKKRAEVAQTMLTLGFDAKARDCDGKTALMIAIESQQYEVLDQLIERSDLDAVDRNGWNAAHYAAAHSTRDLTQRITKLTRDINVRTSENYSILHCAATHQKVETVSWLLSSSISKQLLNKPEYSTTVRYIYMKRSYGQC